MKTSKPTAYALYDFDRRINIVTGSYALCKSVEKQQDRKKVITQAIRIVPYSYK
jgi:hypothetical protein